MSFEYKKYMEMMKSSKINDAKEYKNSNLPKHLYKYISISGENEMDTKKLSSIETNTIWLSRYDILNDPYEFKSTYLENEILSKAGWPLETTTKQLDNFRKTFKISSFTSKVLDNMPMWAHYANNHEGLCVEYKIVDGALIYPVSYEIERYGIAVLFTKIFKCYVEIENGTIFEDDAKYNYYMELLSNTCIMKHKSWSYEEEYRVVYPIEDIDSKGCLVKCNDIGLNINAIYCGYKCSDSNYFRIQRIANKLKIPLYRMFFNNENIEYKLEYR